MLKVQLINSKFGVLECNPDPDGLSDFVLELKRSKENDGVFYEFGVDLKYNKAAREFFRNVAEEFGPMGLITSNLYEYDPNKYRWDLVYSGQSRLMKYHITEDYVQTNFEQIGFERKFLNLAKRDVDIASEESVNGVALPIVNYVDLKMPSKTIRREANISGETEWIKSGFEPGFASIVRLGSPNNRTEFEDSFLGTDVWSTPTDAAETPPDTKNYIMKITEAGSYTIDFQSLVFDLYIEIGTIFTVDPGSNLQSWDIRIMYQVNDNAPMPIYSRVLTPGARGTLPQPPGDFDTSYVDQETDHSVFEIYNQTTDIGTIQESYNVGDYIYIWIDSDIDFLGPGDDPKKTGYRLPIDASEVRISADTVFPETVSRVYLVYEFLESIVRQYTDQSVSFVSDFFGRTDLGYAEDGDGALLAITNGANIREIDKTVFGNWEDVFTSLNAIFCLSWGFEKLEDGTQVVRVEKKEYFFNKDITAVSLGQVSEISKEFMEDRYYQTIEIGYPTVENIDQINGLDEFNSIRRFSSPITETKNKLTITSEYRASGFEIESQRRLSGTTKESKLDDKNFFITLVRDNGFRVELGSDYASITGVIDPATAYNVGIRPGVMIRNWKKVLASLTLRNSDKKLKFTYGEYNYTVTVDGVAENSDIELLDDDAIWYNDSYGFVSKFGKDERELIRANRYGLIKFEDWGGNECSGFILEMKNEIEKKEAEFVLLRAKI